ncbi:protein unc-13 homolog isoform X1 [Cynara cardunculus var. scolymus]|uniref:protein unc-13 homolog isoform X1 n=1 Tax=Cynara cardunculus var. scolymus TaxID=59895 RepID=UPI000D628A23|nr:protein unc-13 homolog isoform X1 [Cynara cardunculus var. scolymus]
MPIENTAGYMIPVLSSNDLSDPFGQLGLDLSDSDLRETAYEIFVGACRSSGGGRPLTYVSQSSGRSSDRASSLPSLQRSLTLTAASKVKKALGMKSKKKNNGSESATENRPATVGELMRVQMRISEQVDSRVRRALLRIAAGQLGRRIESIVLPVELLQQFKSSDFPTQREYEVWQRRNLRVLEAGLLLHPKLPLDRKDPSAQQLRQIIRGAYARPMETGKHSEAVQTLRTVTMQLACRASDDFAPDTCHWADGAPLNLRLYQILLEALFDVEEPTSMIEEVDEVLDLIKKTWGILGIDQRFHNLCFSWVLFNHYVSTGQVENDFLFAADNLLLEVKKDAKSTLDSGYSKILCSTLNSMLEWAERGLLAYHESFYRGNIDLMQSILSLVLSAATILAEENPSESGRRKVIDVADAKVDVYIRSSMRKAFSQESEKVRISRKSAKSQLNHLPALCLLAQDVTDLAFTEKEIYSPILQRWHPLAVGVAVATLHSCFGQEVQKFVSGINELTPAVIQVLIAADKLEKDLVQMAVEDSVNSDDGGKSIIQEMTPYEAEAVIVDLVKSWIKTRVDRLKEWVDRTLQQEVWNPRANREGFAPSAVEVLRTIDETMEAFFLLPIPMHPDLLPGLMSGLDRCLQDYILKAKSGSGSRSSFLPVLPPLTRCRGGSKLNGVFKKKDRSHISQRRTPMQSTTERNDSYSITQLCVRVNSFHYIRKDLEVLEKRTIAHLKSIGIREGSIVNGSRKNFERSLVACVEGIQQVCEATAYKLVFHELSHVLWDGLYVGGVSSSRIEPFLQELEQNLEVIAETVQDNTIRTRLITNIMRASFEGFLLVLLAGGPCRSFTLEDWSIIQEDFQFLMDLFWSNGDGLPIDLIGKHSTIVKGVLPLFSSDTGSLVEKFKSLMIDGNGSSTKSRLALPPTTDQWGPIEPNTILRVLCHRDDKAATTFLKKNYNLPKKL